MSNDNSSAETPKKTLFILKSKPDSLRNAENFLRTREWDLSVATTMREAISLIIAKQPEYALIPADHPNKKVRSLPRILSQAFPIKIITYCESQNTAAINAMHEMGIEYQIFPPISGPAIERTILKLQRDEKKRAEEQEKNFDRKSFEYNNPSSAGDKDPSGLSVMGRNQKSTQALSALQQMLSNADDGESSDGSFAFTQSGSTSGAIGGKSDRPSGIAYMPGQNNPNEGIPGSSTPNGYRPNHSQDSAFVPPGQEGSNSNFNPHDESQREGESFAEWEERIAQQRAASFQNPSALGESDPNYGIHGFNAKSKQGFIPMANPTPEDEFRRNNPAMAGLSDEELRKHLASQTAKDGKTSVEYNKTIAGKKYSSLNLDSIIVKGTQEALDSAVRSTPVKEPVETIQDSQNAICIIVESPRFSGYLVAALGKNRTFDSTFIDTIRSRLFEYLKRQGESAGDENSLDLKLKQVEFEDWAIEHAEFLRKSIHNGDEVAMAFFPTQKVSPDISESAREDMVSIDINDLQGDLAVLFDVYVYLPANNKYILYTPQGGTFLGSQKERMIKKGITKMHMKKDQVNSAKRYTAQNFLNAKIDQYYAELEATKDGKKDPKAS